MASEYMIYKWRLWFRSMDVNHRGEISEADARQTEDTITNLSNVDAERKKEIQEKLQYLWDEYVFKGKTGPVSEDDFVQMIINEYTKSAKAKFREWMQKCYTVFFSVIVDFDHKGFVTEEQFLNMKKSFGHENVALLKTFFGNFGPVDGKVPLQVIIDSYVHFTTSDDSTKTDVVKEALESGV